MTASAPDSLADARLSGDFRITQAHGLQFDVSAQDYAGGYLGQVDSHLYLQPSTRSKYGFFASLADVNGREATIAYLGAEGLFALSNRTVLEIRGGAGYARPGSYDFVGAEAWLSRAVSESLSMYGAVQLVEIQEDRLDSVAWGAEFGATWQPKESPFAFTASAGSTGMSGADSAPAEGYLRLGISWSLGGERGARQSLAARGFRSPRPFDPLLRAGWF
ncbi:hypothetical protein OEW28_15630 [Defluviimonas sp. WL0002]|uniref:Cellulose biosynthesis protein BcsS n=1 Tax=Albidovulum marisflavi TaxID=2984159 RepID=A0ABT2ZH51_9RHOB|nr:hypothetical protein [Defluviimonas sp. WL0002]MCV2870061.1 hypothetical protein [Defluviimonas sp. WL0002]